MPASSSARRCCAGVASRLTPSAASTSAVPDLERWRPVAVLGDLQPAAGQHEGHGGRDVIGVQAVAAGAADVDHLVSG